MLIIKKMMHILNPLCSGVALIINTVKLIKIISIPDTEHQSTIINLKVVVSYLNRNLIRHAKGYGSRNNSVSLC